MDPSGPTRTVSASIVASPPTDPLIRTVAPPATRCRPISPSSARSAPAAYTSPATVPPSSKRRFAPAAKRSRPIRPFTTTTDPAIRAELLIKPEIVTVLPAACTLPLTVPLTVITFAAANTSPFTVPRMVTLFPAAKRSSSMTSPCSTTISAPVLNSAASARFGPAKVSPPATASAAATRPIIGKLDRTNPSSASGSSLTAFPPFVPRAVKDSNRRRERRTLRCAPQTPPLLDYPASRRFHTGGCRATAGELNADAHYSGKKRRDEVRVGGVAPRRGFEPRT